ncbi:MAG: DUF3800 domain-containing protein [Pirellulales bacterium]|nr:DUF3800 domain-containing protein [Pirellulales bacterium]
MANTRNGGSSVRHYFVDEAGDGTLFSRRGRLLVGSEGCSNHFILGLLDITDPSPLEQELTELRERLRIDPYFKGVPSMQPETGKTAIAFHAKNDLPEIRREVYSVLMRHEMRFFAVVRKKHRIAELILEHNRKRPDYRYHPNQLYDRCVSRLFKERLHKDDGYAIRFAKRGNKNRTAALQRALEAARNNLRRSWNIVSSAPIEIMPSAPKDSGGLQAVDYFLWALQRLYERREERYWEFVLPSVSLVHDVDDIRNHEYGEYYSKKNPLTLTAQEKK